jgi:glycosyltransferase involved in cell wall biosynthesis
MATVFVFFPVFNTGDLLRDFLEKLAETRDFLGKLNLNVHSFAVDDGSTCAYTRSILDGAPTLNVLRHNTNEGCAVALKTALAHMESMSEPGDYMVWLDADGEHRPMQLTGLLPILMNKSADLALAQIIWQEHHMSEFDRKLQEGMGALEAEVIFGARRRWHQHCPGFWVVRAEFLRKTDVVKCYNDYLLAFKAEYGSLPRWGEDMTFAACVHTCGGIVNDDTITQSHMPAPNRPATKIVDQYYRALMHMRLYQTFFAGIQKAREPS